MVLRTEVFLPHFPDYLAKLVLEEFGKLPYPMYLQKLLTADFLRILTEQGSVPIQSVIAESVPVHAPVPAPESEQSSVIIEWDDLQQPIGFHRIPSESAELRSIRSSSDIVPIAMHKHSVASRPALVTENEHHLAPMDRLNEQNSVVSDRRAFLGPLPIVHLRLVPFHPLEQLEDAPPVSIESALQESALQTALIVDNHTPLYNANGYKVTQVSTTFARLHFSLTPEHHF